MPRSFSNVLVVMLLAVDLPACTGLDNGLGLLPPMGWRNWWSMFGNVDQAKMEESYAKMAERHRHVVGKTGLFSFVDLGYTHAGLDDAWQKCGAGVNGSFHDKEGNPLVDEQQFPDLEAMVSKASALGLQAGWYLNNCKCGEKSSLTDPTFIDLTIEKTVAALVKFNFTGLKLDGCGPANNLTRWAEVINATGHAVAIEDCHWGDTVPTGKQPNIEVSPADDGFCAGLQSPSECPYNFYRSSGDVINSFERVHHNVHTLVPFLGEPPLSKPGAWAYADGMELGRMSGPYSNAEDRTIFGWYVITSSPLYLGHNISDDSTNDRVWPIVSNTEAISINQQWSGHPGKLVRTWDNPDAGKPEWPLGRGVYNVSCDSSDITQKGWAYDTKSQQLHGPGGKCMDMQAADNRQLWVVDCDALPQVSASQQWTWGPPDSDGFASLITTKNNNSLAVPGSQNSVGFGRKGSKVKTTFRIQHGHLQTNTGSCLAARAINPVSCPKMDPKSPSNCATFELWSKQLKDEATAVLLVNNGLPANVTFSLTDLGIKGPVQIRDVWNHKDAGQIAKGGSYTAPLGVHDSSLLIIKHAAWEYFV